MSDQTAQLLPPDGRHASARIHQHAHRVEMPSQDRREERGKAGGLAMVDIRSSLEEASNRAGMALGRRMEEWSTALGIRGMKVCPRLDRSIQGHHVTALGRLK